MNGKALKGELRIASKLRINYFRIIINDKQNLKSKNIRSGIILLLSILLCENLFDLAT